MTRVANVDRDNEIALFEAMLAEKTSERILLVCAEAGWGKSILLREFERRCPTNIPHFAKLDFKSCTSLAETLSHLCDSLGWSNFPHFKTAVQGIVQPLQVNVAHNVMIGQNQIAVALGGPDQETSEARRAELTNAFFADLRALGRALLLLDTFEKGDETVQTWLSGSFLPRAQRSPNLFVVLAGRRVPDQAIDWECCDLPLGSIAPEHWLVYAQSLGIQGLTLELIQNCWQTYRGHTITIAIALQAFASPGYRR